MAAADDAARAGLKLVKWLAGKGDDVVATAEDLKRFGPNAVRVRSLLDFVPGLSEDAAKAVRINYSAPKMGGGIKELDDVLWKADPRRAVEAELSGIAGTDVGSTGFRWRTGLPDVSAEAAMAESVSDLLSPQTYQALTNPLAAARAIDILRNRPRLQNTPFLDIVRRTGEAGGIMAPRDVVAASRIAQKPADIQEIFLTLVGDGMPVEEAMRTARLLAQ